MKFIIGICCLLLLELFAVGGAEEMQGKKRAQCIGEHSKNYVDQILPILNHHSLTFVKDVDISRTTYIPLLVNVVCEHPLGIYVHTKIPTDFLQTCVKNGNL